MPYDKGDFTQQGINGDVSALVRLNEKRVMKVVLSSDDESDNCDISGKVYDLLNGTSYDIGSGVSGNIEITENGENINVAPYATATVNVSGGGDSDFTTAEITIINPSTEYSSETYAPFVLEANEITEGSPATLYYSYQASANSTKVCKIALYKGHAMISNADVDTFSGDITELSSGLYDVTGDCSITTEE